MLPLAAWCQLLEDVRNRLLRLTDRQRGTGAAELAAQEPAIHRQARHKQVTAAVLTAPGARPQPARVVGLLGDRPRFAEVLVR